MKKLIYLLFVLICLICIYYFSSKDGKESNQNSKKLIRDSVYIMEKTTGKDFNEKRIVNTWNYPIRKIAHFTIFFILGIFMYLFINTFDSNKKILISIILCFICSIADETHQIFSLGRTPLILDVLIDTLGSFIGIMMVSYINKIYYTHSVIKLEI